MKRMALLVIFEKPTAETLLPVGMACSVSLAKKHEVREQEKRSRDLENRGRGRQEWCANRKGNKQKHYREPLLQQFFSSFSFVAKVSILIHIIIATFFTVFSPFFSFLFCRECGCCVCLVSLVLV